QLQDPYASNGFNGTMQSEDCLYLNLWSPAKTVDEKLPVFVWVHGGGMMAGTAMSEGCDGDFIASHGVVVVSINYRLGFYGFFCHPELAAESEDGRCGNNALFDMRQAVLWLRENVAAFGGDPDNITIGGQSGGAVGSNLLLISPMMKGLVKRIVIESGTCFHGMMQPKTMEQQSAEGEAFLKAIGCDSIADLRKMDAVDLLRLTAAHRMTPNHCIDGLFLPDRPQDMENRGEFNDVDVLVGATAQEFAAGLKPDALSPERFEAYIRKQFGDKAEDVLAAYPHGDSREAGHSYHSIFGDLHFIGVIRTAEELVRYGKKAYAYYLTKPGLGEDGELIGAVHSSELPYVFGWKKDLGGGTPWGEEEYAFSETLGSFWANFVKTGDPGAPWKAFEKRFDAIELGKRIGMLDEKTAARLQLIYDIIAPNTYSTAGDYIDRTMNI
ncbi:MAG: carboxylesterase family protein, partial [Erysipelotrichaceae bacterium]|nr:carboxylesterase family protein [Erysipelotrichaceae bacterium]